MVLQHLSGGRGGGGRPGWARDRKGLQSDPWHVTEIGRPFEEGCRESGVDRGDDGLARRVCLLFRLLSVSFSFIS